jgi:transposase
MAISLARVDADVALAARSREELESAKEKASELGRRAAGWVRDLIKQKGCQLWLHPSYSPDFNPIEVAFSKVKCLIRKAKSRTLDALFTATAGALGEVSEEGVRAFFEDYSYKRPQGHSL